MSIAIDEVLNESLDELDAFDTAFNDDDECIDFVMGDTDNMLDEMEDDL